MKATYNNLKNKKSTTDSSTTVKVDNTSQVNTTDLVKPSDFEASYNQLKNQIVNDKHKALLRFNEGDVKIIKLAKERIYVNDGVPDNIEEAYMSCNLAKYCIEFYLSHWIYTIFKDMSYNGLYYNLIGINSYLPEPNTQKFIVDENREQNAKEQNQNSQTNGPTVFKTKGTYFEKNLAVCKYKDYQNFIKRKEESLSNTNNNNTAVSVHNSNGPTSKNVNSPAVYFPKLILFCLREHVDGNKILKESMPRGGHQPVTLYLESIEAVREIGACWILLSLKGKDDFYLYTGTNENQKLWLAELKDISMNSGPNKKMAMSQDSLDKFEDNVQSMIAKFLQENEVTSSNSRKKDRQKILTLHSDIRTLIRQKAPPETTLFNPGYFEGAEIRDIDIRRQVEQSTKRNLIKLTATRFLTGLSIQQGKDSIVTVTPPEPFFVSMFLVHLQDGRRISEEFFWNPNTNEIESMIPDSLFINRWIKSNSIQFSVNTPNGLSTFSDKVLQNTKSFLLRIAYSLENVGLVIKVEKVISGSLSSVLEKYGKSNGLDLGANVASTKEGDCKTAANLHKNMAIYCSNIGHYRMPFAWSAFRISTNQDIKTTNLYKYDGNKISDEDLIKQVQSLLMSRSGDGYTNSSSVNTGSSSAKLSEIPSIIQFQVEEVDYKKEQAELASVNSEYVCKINACPKEIKECCKEVREFVHHPIQKWNQSNNSSAYNNQSQRAYSSITSNQQSDTNSNSNSIHAASLHDFSDDNSPGERTPPPGFEFQPFSMSANHNSDHNSLTNQNQDFPDSLCFHHNYESLPEGNHVILRNTSNNNSITWEDLVSPNLEFSHTLYLYPRGLNFSNQNHFSRARNLSCFVEFRDSDKIDAAPLRVFYSRSNNKQPAFDTWANLAITYHESNPVFTEEIKICLPVKLHSKHHLLFRFYHVSVDTASSANAREKSSNKKPLETSVGFAWLALLDDKANLRNGNIEVPVAVNLMDDYLNSTQAIQSIQWVDNRKSIFRLVLCPYTTIYTQEVLLHEFFKMFGDHLSSLYQAKSIGHQHHPVNNETYTDNDCNGGAYRLEDSDDTDSLPLVTTMTTSSSVMRQIDSAVKSLVAINSHTLIRFIGPILNQLIQIIVTAVTTDHMDIAKTAVEVIIKVTKNLRATVIETISPRSRKRNTKILKSYIKYCFDADKFIALPDNIPTPTVKSAQNTKITRNRPVHECIVQTIVDILTPPFRDVSNVRMLLFNSFIFYSIITKSMIQTLQGITPGTINTNGSVGSTKSKGHHSASNDKSFPNSYMETLEQLVHLVTDSILYLTHQTAASTVQSNGGNNMTSSGSNITGHSYTNESRRATITSTTLNSINNHESDSLIAGLSGANQKNTTGKGLANSLERAANRELARFLSRLLNVTDKGFVFQRIHQYMRIITDRINQFGPDREELCQMKFEFLEIIVSHEYYIPLNLLNPQYTLEKASSASATTLTPTGGQSPELHLTESYCKQHYLSGLLLQQIHKQMTDIYSEYSTRRMPIMTLRNLLTKHTMDDRYRSMPAFQSRISALYLPLLSIVLENKSTLSLPGPWYSSPHNAASALNDHNNGSDLSRPVSIYSGGMDNISVRSGWSAGALVGGGSSGYTQSGSASQSESGSVYGMGGTYMPASSRPPSAAASARNSAAYLDKDGKVDSRFLNQIAGMNDLGEFRYGRQGTHSSRTSSRTDSSDTASIHSTNTIIGIDELDETKTDTRSQQQQNRSSTTKTLSMTRPTSASQSLGKKSGLQFSLTRKTTNTSSASNLNGISAGGGGIANAFTMAANYKACPKTRPHLSDKVQADVFICLFHILGTVSHDDLKTTIGKLTVQDRIELLQLLIYAIHHFKYKGRKDITNFDAISRPNIQSNAIQLRMGGGSRSIDVADSHKPMCQQNEDKAGLDGNMSVEIGLVILEVISVVCSVFKSEILSYSPDHALFQKIITVYKTLISMNQSETVLCHAFVSLRVFITNFAKVLFSSCHNIVCDLSLHTLRFCDCTIASVRAEACGFLYRMMRVSFDTCGLEGFNRVHLQMIVAVSKLDRLVGASFEKSLRFLKALSESEMHKQLGSSATTTSAGSGTGTTKKASAPPVPALKPKPSIKSGSPVNNTPAHYRKFFTEVIDLTDRIRTVLMATMHMNEHKDDPEMLVDLQYSLARSYSSNPALRRTWLEKIYNVHKKHNCRAEMALCKAHIAAMVTEYLRKKDPDSLPENYPLGCRSFKEISPNIPSEEGYMKNDTSQLEVHYSKEEVVKMLREVAEEFSDASLWEVNRHVYKLLLPIYETARDYERLAYSYQHLADGYRKVRSAEATSNQRLIATYFRVVLLGQPFDDLAGKVFVYRLAGGTQFCGAYETLQSLFEKKYGSNRVNMLQDNYVDRDSLNPALASVQITHLEPYFGENELLERQSVFEKHYNVSRFMFETPFVKSKESQLMTGGSITARQTEDLTAQWKRRTILTVESSFPNLKRRLEVVSTSEIDFSPIERAIDELKAKNRQLNIHRVLNTLDHGGIVRTNSSSSHNSMATSKQSGTAQTNTNPTNNREGGNILMDMHLMGALLPQVNQGPMAYARVFLDKSVSDQFSSEQVKLLKVEFMIFLTQCHHLLLNYYQLMTQVHEMKYDAMRNSLDNYRIELIDLVKEEITLNEEYKVISSGNLVELVYNTLMSRSGSSSTNNNSYFGSITGNTKL